MYIRTVFLCFGSASQVTFQLLVRILPKKPSCSYPKELSESHSRPAASILAGVGVLWAGMSMGLPGIYLGIFLQYGILAIRYIRQKKGKNDVVSEGLVYRD